VRTTNTHDKLALVHSRHGVSRAPRKLVLNGSHNLTRIANYGNDELLVKMFNDEVYDEMLAEHYEHLWARAEPVSP
jgi:phosphatidylserine/phosphatidylglycerophosphate/cardiolipin synthase-like enzyme